MGLRLDLHVHSKASFDSLLDIPTIIRVAKNRGLGGVAITDHNTAEGVFKALSDGTKREDDGFLLIPGIEFSTDKGHVLGLFIEREPEVSAEKGSLLPFESAVRAVHDAKGIAVLAHPYQIRAVIQQECFDGHGGDFCDALEAFNSRAPIVRNPRANLQADSYAKLHRLPVTGGSDAHFAWEIGRGGCVIGDLSPSFGGAEVKEAILEGRAVTFGRPSLRAAKPLSGLVGAMRRGQYSSIPRYALRVALALLGPVGDRLEDALRGRRL